MSDIHTGRPGLKVHISRPGRSKRTVHTGHDRLGSQYPRVHACVYACVYAYFYACIYACMCVFSSKTIERGRGRLLLLHVCDKASVSGCPDDPGRLACNPERRTGWLGEFSELDKMQKEKKRGQERTSKHVYLECYSSRAASNPVGRLVASPCPAPAANGTGGKGGVAASRHARHRVGDGGRSAAASLKRAIDMMADGFRRSPGRLAGWLFWRQALL